ncbi:mitotic spindle checkpoint protein MAD1 [Coffea eugenioides]|uniref:mitotic spindle checkpoint protein MAD1 n=1 Tax=Coffea eugenioides TaxID=49369 RepID=UPI000F609024|nr:mitotic spindle checkpoint protein MAD1 [Coffea eugenioides]
MILRTPAPRKRRAESALLEEDNQFLNSRSPNNTKNNVSNSNKQLVIYEDSPSAPVPESSHDHPITSDHMLCTYQCRQMVKAEFFDALSNAEKQARECQSKLDALNEDFCKAETERKRFRDKLLSAEQELAAAKRREQDLQEQLMKGVNSSEERLRRQLQLFNELEIKFQNEVNLREKAQSLAALAEEKASALEAKLQKVSQSTEKEKIRLQNELAHLKSDSKLSVSRISADLERMECRAKHAEEESKLLKDQMEQLGKRLHECMQQKGEMEKRLLHATPQESPSTDSSILLKHLQEELRNYESEVHEARKLKSSHENVELLKEKLQEEKRRRERAELDLLKLPEIQLRIEKLQDELSAWKSLMKDIPGVSCADDVPMKFAALQKEVIDSMMKVGEAQVRLKEIEVALDAAELDKQNAITEATLAKEKAESSKSEVKRIELMLASALEERDRLKNMFNELKREKHAQGGPEVASGALVQELEASIAKKENYIKELESNLHEQNLINIHQQNEIKLLSVRLTDEARRIKSLEREGDRLRSELALLESKLGHGDFSSANTKVLRMVNTLAVDNEAKQTIEALQNELQKTKEKLQAVEELKKQSADAGTLVDSYVSGKIVQLKEQIATLEKREERYKTVFAERISVFRRACCELFGYKIVMDDHQRPDGIPVTRFTLQSIYAQADDERLEFEYESGNTNITVNDYTRQPEISHQVEIFIRKMNSIPAFTANLTMESFNKRTLS